MIPTIDTCEWNPGINRSIVSIEIAAQNVRSEDRSLLIANFNKKNFSDLVEIRKDRISGQKNQYGATISNMNFARNRLCHHITRAQWKEETVVSAMVFSVNGRSYGYASVCGNLFELTKVEDAPTKPNESTSIPYEFPANPEPTYSQPSGPTTIYEGGQSFTEVYHGGSGGAYSTPQFAGGAYGVGYVGGGSPTFISSPPVNTPGTPELNQLGVTPVPELPVWSYLGIGVALLMFFKRRMKDG